MGKKTPYIVDVFLARITESTQLRRRQLLFSCFEDIREFIVNKKKWGSFRIVV